MKNKSWVKKRHSVFLYILKPLVKLYLHLTYHIKFINYKLKKNENVLIFANHQTDLDPIFLEVSFNKPIYLVATDSLFSNKLLASFLNYAFAPIAKKKGISDPRCIKNIMKVAKEKGTIGIFIEGNRTYAEFQYYIDRSVAKLVKALKMPLLLVNIKGGTGVMPRFANKKRNGKISLSIAKRLEYEEYKDLDDDVLLKIIKDSIKVYDSESNQQFKSKKRAEYLERMLFVCPCCNKVQTLYSKNEFLYCNSCNLKVEYTTDLHLKSANKDFKFIILNDWYEFQKKWCVNSSFLEGENIFVDNDVALYISHVNEPRKLICNGTLKLTNKSLVFAKKIIIPLKDIVIASCLSGTKFNFSTHDESYLVIGNKRFNPLKYVLMFNKLPTHMKEKKLDKYFNLD